MPKDLTVINHLLDLIASTLGRKFDIDILINHPLISKRGKKRLMRAQKLNKEAAEEIKNVRRELEKK